jgi:hypothetical protein
MGFRAKIVTLGMALLALVGAVLFVAYARSRASTSTAPSNVPAPSS